MYNEKDMLFEDIVTAQWVLILLLIMLIIIISLLLANAMEYINFFYGTFNQTFTNVCDNVPPIIYREPVYIPHTNGVYEKSLATALVDISFNTSRSNCTAILPIPNPPGFNNQLRIEPLSREKLMFAYIFWNPELGSAVISFTGTEVPSEWASDLQFQQVPPIAINGYKDGVMMHKGFYDIYMSIRDQLWNWWNSNYSWVETLYITGHSLGGALSTICGYDFAESFLNNSNSRNSQTCGPNVCNCESNNCDCGSSNCNCSEPFDPCMFPIHYSFAAPRGGNNNYANEFNKRMPTSIRVNNTEDIVPALPPSVIGDYKYDQTRGNIPFTVSLGSIQDNHSKAYIDYLPECAQVAKCRVTEQ